MVRTRWVRPVLVGALALVPAAVLVAPGASSAAKVEKDRAVNGVVTLADKPVPRASVRLMASGPEGGTASVVAETTANPQGRFTFPARPSRSDGEVLYLVAEHPTLPVALVDVLGVEPPTATTTVNERTSVAAAYAFARFADGTSLAGPRPGLPNAVGMAHNMADPKTGDIAQVLARIPNGTTTETLSSFNSLANLVSTCAGGPSACATFLTNAAAPTGAVPADTFAALVNIARAPWNNVNALSAIAQTGPASNQPARTTPPAAWTVALRFVGDGQTMNGPGNVAIDHEGGVWVTNNTDFSLDPFAPVCGSDLVLKFLPDGRYAPHSPYSGGGLNGAGYGIDIDRHGDVWISNFGFAAVHCDSPPPSNSVSQFHPDGSAASPANTGWTGGNIDKPQGTVVAPNGDVWVANCANGTVTVVHDGDGTNLTSFDTGLVEPFDIDFASDGTGFVTGTQSRSVGAYTPDGHQVPGTPVPGFGQPMGVAVDSTDHVWVSDSGILLLPCGTVGDPAANAEPSGLASMSLLTRTASGFTKQDFTGGGITIPWGVAVDGNDNVWVANFGQRRLSLFCGTKAIDCRPGTTTGAAISPDTGYAFDGFDRNTGLGIDPSGNVWVVNNWKETPPARSNPGGHEMVVYVGAAEPVVRPAPVPKPEVVMSR